MLQGTIQLWVKSEHCNEWEHIEDVGYIKIGKHVMKELFNMVGLSDINSFSRGEYGFMKHLEVDYNKEVRIGNLLTIDISIIKVGDTSFSICFIFSLGKAKAAEVTFVRVLVSKKDGSKLSIPDSVRRVLESDTKYTLS